MTNLGLRRARSGCLVPLAIISLAAPSWPAEPQTIRMAGYSISIPNGWWVQKDKALDKVWACNRADGKCTGTGGGFPLPGIVFVSFMPAEHVVGQESVEEIVESVPHAGSPAPDVSPVELGSGKRCLVARSLLFDKVWDEIYGIEIQGHFFRAWVQYGREPDKEVGYRSAIAAILSSVSVPGN